MEAVLWANNDEISSRLIRESSLLEELQRSSKVREQILSLIAQRGKETISAIVEKFHKRRPLGLSRYCRSNSQNADRKTLDTIEKNIFNQPLWKGHQRFVELLKGEEVTVENLVRALKKGDKRC